MRSGFEMRYKAGPSTSKNDSSNDSMKLYLHKKYSLSRDVMKLWTNEREITFEQGKRFSYGRFIPNYTDLLD